MIDKNDVEPVENQSLMKSPYVKRFFYQWIILSTTVFIMEYCRVLSFGFSQSLSLSVILWGLLSASAGGLLLCTYLIVSSCRYSWPNLSKLDWPKRITLFFSILSSYLIVVVCTQMAVEWSTKQFRQSSYRGLFAGLIAATIMSILLLIVPIFFRIINLGITQVFHLLTTRFKMICPGYASFEKDTYLPMIKWGLVSFSAIICWFSASLTIYLLPSLETVDLRLPRLLLMGAWATITFTIILKNQLSSDKYNTLGLRAASSVCVMTTLIGLIFGYTMNPEQALRVHRDTSLGRIIIAQLQIWSDDDKDGVSSRWGGGDCNDNDATIRPGIPDKYSNKDHNCNGINKVKYTPIKKSKVDSNRTSAHPQNVLLLTIDALRYDAYRKAMPHTQAFAEQSIDFTNAYSAAAATYWSVPALLGSRPPSYFKMGRDQTPVNTERLLTESLRDAKFHTALFANVTIFFVRGLSQGAYTKNYETSRYTVHGAKPGAAHLTQGLIKHIDRWRSQKLKPKRERFFLWGHYYDPHDPYFEVQNFPASDRSAKAHYLAIVQSVDQQLGILFEALKDRNLLKNTMVILTADHGDEFYDHGHRFHGKTLYDEMIKVPLIIYSPHYSPKKIDDVVSHIDVAPTVLSHLGLPSESRFMGNDYDHALRSGQSLASEGAFFEILPDQNYGQHMVGYRTGHKKWIYHLDKGAIEYYDLLKDPQERTNLYQSSHRLNHQSYSKLMTYVEQHLMTLSSGAARVKLPSTK